MNSGFESEGAISNAVENADMFNSCIPKEQNSNSEYQHFQVKSIKKMSRAKLRPQNREFTAEEIIPDISLSLDDEANFNLINARFVLDRLIDKFGLIGDVNLDCLHKILQMDLAQGNSFLKDAPHGPTISANTFATMQSMIRAYLVEQLMVMA